MIIHRSTMDAMDDSWEFNVIRRCLYLACFDILPSKIIDEFDCFSLQFRFYRT